MFVYFYVCEHWNSGQDSFSFTRSLDGEKVFGVGLKGPVLPSDEVLTWSPRVLQAASTIFSAGFSHSSI